jgi:hypothetical protein
MLNPEAPIYRDWCGRYLANNDLSAEEWYEVRCILLHRGRTLPEREDKPKGRYHRYSFSQPDPQGNTTHRQKKNVGGRAEINFDVWELMTEVQKGMKVWFNQLASGNTSAEVIRNVEKNLSTLANVAHHGEEEEPGNGGIPRETIIINLSTASPYR